MSFSRLACAAAAVAVIAAAVGALGGCKVDKAELARRVDLKNVDLRTVPDGVYESSYTIVVPSAAANKTVRVRVTVTGGRYERIEILQPAKLGDSQNLKTLISKVEESQTLSVDAVSGATITSTAILKAIQTAVSTPK
ncbi:MAG: FMN-binding protein [Spirochaetia bacterium]|jgi:uncharacterized protein with FMN-binding domain